MLSERFWLDEELDDIASHLIERIEWIVSSRFDQDSFELHHHVDDSAVVTTAVVTRSVNGEGMDDL